MAFVNDNQTIVVISQCLIKLFTVLSDIVCLINQFAKASGGNKSYAIANLVYGVLVKICNCVLPCPFYGRRCDNQHFPIPLEQICLRKKFLDNEQTHHRLSKSDNIAQDKTTMILHYEETLLHCIHLI